MRVQKPWPMYKGISDKEFEQRVKKARDILSSCRLCPRNCGVDRHSGETGVCRAKNIAEVASYNDHHGEEPPLSGCRGSGTIFFAHCNLRCVFCQNYPISHYGNGQETSADELADMMLRLQRRGCHNINFVTPTHMMPFILEALPLAVKKGLDIPLVYNCGGYESMQALELLDGIIDIYLPDMKYSDNRAAKRLSQAPDYVERNREAIKEMHRQVGDLVLDEEGIAMRGLIVRHLVLPGGQAGTEGVMEFLANQVSKNTAISLMSQYFPAFKASEQPGLSRRVNDEEYERAAASMKSHGLREGWMQGGP